MAKYVYDKKTGTFQPRRFSFLALLRNIAGYLLASLLVGVVFYGVFALAFDTDREKQLQEENRLLTEEHDRMAAQLALLDSTIGDLQVRDREIYRDLFSADPPRYFFEMQDTLLSGDLSSMREDDLVWDSYAVTKRMESVSRQVTASLAEIDSVFAAGAVKPTASPSIVPLKDFMPVQTGASVGKKINPFYKNVREHTGLDLVAPVGTPVRCTADGRVLSVVRSEKGMGNQVTVDHGGGFRTCYAHLDEINVSQGQTLKQGAVLGKVGQSGSCFAPCLHYEVLRDGFAQDPVNYFFAELDPATYRDMMIVALTTGQSMD